MYVCIIFSELMAFGLSPSRDSSSPAHRLSKDDCDSAPERVFHLRYRDIVGSLGYLYICMCVFNSDCRCVAAGSSK